MLIFEYPFKDFLALDRAVGTGELQGVVAWALSYRRFPTVDLVVRTTGPEETRVELRLLAGPGVIATVIPFDVGDWDDLDADARETLGFYTKPNAERDIAIRWQARGESPDDLEETRAAWDYLAFQYLSTWERDDDSTEESSAAADSLAPERSETRASFAPRSTGADIELIEASHSICLLASANVEQAAVGRAVFGVEAESMKAITRWTIVDVDAESQLLVLRETRRRGEGGQPTGPLVAWFAPLWTRDIRRLLEDAEDVSEVDCLLGAGLREPIVGASRRVPTRTACGRGREIEIGALPPTLLDRAPGVAKDIALSVRRAVTKLSGTATDSDSLVPGGFNADGFVVRRAARVLMPGVHAADDPGPLCGYRLAGPILCHGVGRLLILEWAVPGSDESAAAEILASGAGEIRSYLVGSTHAADEIAALRSLQGAFALDHPA